MDLYYGIGFLLLAFVQEHVEGFLVSITCSLVGFFSNILILSLKADGINLYLAAGLLDLGLFFIFLSLIGTTVGVIASAACFLSLIFNLACYTSLFKSPEIYALMKSYYGVVNIIIFEILLYSCLINSKAKVVGRWISKKFGIDKFIEEYNKTFKREET